MSAGDGGTVSYRLSLRLLRRRRAFWVTGAAVAALGVLLGGIPPFGAVFGAGLALVLGVSLAAAPDPDDLRAGAVFHLVGARRRQRRAVVAWTSTLILLPGAAIGLGVAVVGDAFALHHLPSARFLVVFLLIGEVSSILATRSRLRTEEAAEVGTGGRVSATSSALLAALGLVLIVGAGALPSTSSTGWELSLSLLVAWIGVGVGLLLLLPALVRIALVLMQRLPVPVMRLAGGRAMPAMGTSIWLVALGTTVLVSATVIGFGLVGREQPRLAALQRYDLRQGTADDQVIVREAGPTVFGPTMDGLSSSFTDAALAAVRETPGLAEAVPVLVPIRPLGGLSRSPVGGLVVPSLKVEPGPLGSPGTSTVAVATPELLAVLDASSFGPFIDGGGALALNRTRLDRGRVSIAVSRIYRDAAPVRRLRLAARALKPRRVAVGLPAALVSAATIRRLTSDIPQPLLVVGRAPTFSSADRAGLQSRLDAVASGPGSFGLHSDIALGSDPFDLGLLDRTDAPSVSLVRDEPSLLGVLGAGLGGYLLVVAVTTRFVALSRRREDEVFEVLGAPAGVVPRIAAVQAGVVATVGVLVGAAIGFGATLTGLYQYNHNTRLDAQTVFPAIPVYVPPLLLIGLVLMPLVSAAVAALMARWRPALDPTLLGERLATDFQA